VSKRTNRKSKELPIRQLMSRNNLFEPPDGVLRSSFALASRLPESTKSVLGWMIRCLFDSEASPIPAGVRSGGPAERRVLYEIRSHEGAEPSQLDLRLRREARGTTEITGQLLPPPESGSVRIGLPGKRARTTSFGIDGEFLFRGLASQPDWTVEIKLPGRPVILIEDLNLNEHRGETDLS